MPDRPLATPSEAVRGASTAEPVVLVIDDDPLVSVLVRRALEPAAFRLHTAGDGRTGMQEVITRQPDLIVLDHVLPDGLGVDILSDIHLQAPEIPVLFVTARGSGSTAIAAMKRCAFDYLSKPLDPIKLRPKIDRALALRRFLQSPPTADATLPSSSTAGENLDGLVGECPTMQLVFKAIGKVAPQDVAVLIRGEHGTGKESVAREIHRHSARHSAPFVKQYCLGDDRESLEEELFGRVGGRSGRIAEAAGGTLLLQEVGGLPLTLQAKLLRAARDGAYEPVGSTRSEPVRCRLLAISSEDLEAKVRSGAFRSDLYYALSSFVIHIPSLRQRAGDIPLLVEHTLTKLGSIARGFGVTRPRVSAEALQALCTHMWPGNIDELESVLKRCLVEQKGNLLLASDLQAALASDPVIADVGVDSRYTTDWASFAQMRIEAGADTLHAEAVAEAERKVIQHVLRHTAGNQAKASRILGITRVSLRKKMRLYRLSPTDGGE